MPVFASIDAYIVYNKYKNDFNIPNAMAISEREKHELNYVNQYAFNLIICMMYVYYIFNKHTTTYNGHDHMCICTDYI